MRWDAAPIHASCCFSCFCITFAEKHMHDYGISTCDCIFTEKLLIFPSNGRLSDACGCNPIAPSYAFVAYNHAIAQLDDSIYEAKCWRPVRDEDERT
mmetsp:Transcript_32440/g.75679  ORF Transcript_32440/g.75679 Transcript_32440/m.75679 type:complete len:97 (-) Transcript_32440:1707-1997(-)